MSDGKQSCRKSELAIIRCFDADRCSPPEEIPEGRIRAPAVGTRDSKLLWRAKPQRVLLLKKWRDRDARDAAVALGDWLRESFAVAVFTCPDLEDTAQLPTRFPALPTRGGGPADLPADSLCAADSVDLIVSVGGDGTVLHLCSMFQQAVPPVIAVACGSLGFLTAHSLRSAQAVLSTIFGAAPISSPSLGGMSASTSSRAAAGGNGNSGRRNSAAASSPQPVPVSLRMRLTVSVYRRGAVEGVDPPESIHVVLNELLLERGASPYMATVNCSIDDVPLTQVAADGLIIATQSGSSAYALSAGSSLLSPNAAGIVFCPICPHTLSFRPVVLPDSSKVMLEIPADARARARASFDGRNSCELSQGDFVVIRSAPWPLPLICRKGALADWVKAIKGKLLWNVRQQQKPWSDTAVFKEKESSAGTPADYGSDTTLTASSSRTDTGDDASWGRAPAVSAASAALRARSMDDRVSADSIALPAPVVPHTASAAATTTAAATGGGEGLRAPAERFRSFSAGSDATSNADELLAGLGEQSSDEDDEGV